MALIDIDKKYPFLNNVELKELKNKNKDDVILKTIKFNQDEHILLKYITHLGKNFGSYIKQLIEKDVEDNLGNKTKDVNISEEYLVNLIEKVLEKNNFGEATTTIKENKKIDKEMLNDLDALGIKRR
ncbi:hypothetical protein G8T60_12735 [Clostridium botulinum C]|uniref:hypothetical protein n=1 Tax=Clostridium botulinum TaxID=1491 RepID=UPI001E305FAC|nr:hypothetical protein [Clostridium botulinum]MCD3206755.1 hypothetical protein [Clostridium botulinum C]MCD3209660.1 hypothetical protein [Clostridium botulinum C]MCD3226555.1 hypothetical protein [Clostridium botulinum C]MCD3248989.1 hypothetical protein [Clostridium botulinum C]MCD3257573.1 hypothetical protein [Clostridium botulinum C]